MSRSSASGRERAQVFSAVQQVTISPIVYVSRAMGDLIAKVYRARNSSEPVLITGETGTGKELLARAVHDVSARREREFIPFNCGTANHELIESRLFGHQRGSLTGADRDSNGIVREANGGTLLLDEVGELSLDAQPILLRFLQEREVHPLGAPRPVKADVRVIAATNRELEADIRSGRFRADLYQRLKALWLHILPLRERREDIRPLIEYFFDRYQRQEDKHALRLKDKALDVMLGYNWPGNVRELANVLYRLVILAENNEEIGPERVLEEIGAGVCAPPPAAVVVEGRAVIDLSLPLHEAVEELKRLQIEHALKQTGGNLQQAAARLKVDRGGLRETINRLGIEVERNSARKFRK